jgi:ankyrin repeat protein
MAATLLDRGSDVETVTRWWSSGLFLNDFDPNVARFLADRGAKLSIHAAAALGLADLARAMLADDPSQVRAKGGDGCTPLHFARNIDTATLLLEFGADLDARDDDHNSTPAQWLVKSSPDVVAFLLERGATSDIFLAVALGDQLLVEKLWQEDPSCVSHRIGKAPWHSIGYEGKGGTILQWTLEFNCYSHQIAARKGDYELYKWLFDHSDPMTQFLVSCVMADRTTAESLRATYPELVGRLPDVDRELLARYCWETNANIEAVRLMLDCGFPVDFPERSHGYSPLHNAAWGGFADLVDLLIARGHPTDLRDPVHNGTPLDWSIHCCIHDGRHPEGQYARVVAALIDAGCPWNPAIYPTGNTSVDEALLQRMP